MVEKYQPGLYSADVTFLEPMLHPRDNHSCVKVNDFYIMVVGGSKTPTCEMFNMLTERWQPKKSLQKIRFCATLFLHNNIDLYLIYGQEEPNKSGQKIFSSKVEKYELFEKDENLNKEWEYIDFEQVNFKIDRLCLSSIVKMNTNEILIVGGSFMGGNGNSQNLYKIDFDTKKILFDGRVLKTKVCFNESNFLQISDVEFALYSQDMKFIKLKNEKVVNQK